MSHTKWNVEDIEKTRLQFNDLQQQMELYANFKRLSGLFFNSIIGGVKNRLYKSDKEIPNSAKSKLVGDFFAKNPDFKPYSIKLKTPPVELATPKILHVIPYFITGGSQQLVVDIIEALSDQYIHEVALLAIHDEQGYVGVTIHDCSGIKYPEDFTAVLSRVKPDIMHVHYYGQWPHGFWKWYHLVFQGAFAYGLPVIENCNIPYMPYFHSGIARYIYVSKYVRDTFGVRNMPNEVIYPGSNFSFFQRANTQPDPDTIGMVYRLDDDKLNDRAIEPFIRTVQKRISTKVLIVGGGKYLELFKQKVVEAGLQSQFTFTGYVAYDKLSGLYQQMSIFVAPVYSESFGQVTPFAMNMGIPVVAYNIGALDEMLSNPEVLAPSDDAELLSDIIVGLLNDSNKREQIGAFNKARATELFGVETMVNEYRHVYKSLI